MPQIRKLANSPVVLESLFMLALLGPSSSLPLPTTFEQHPDFVQSQQLGDDQIHDDRHTKRDNDREKTLDHLRMIGNLIQKPSENLVVDEFKTIR